MRRRKGKAYQCDECGCKFFLKISEGHRYPRPYIVVCPKCGYCAERGYSAQESRDNRLIDDVQEEKRQYVHVACIMCGCSIVIPQEEVGFAKCPWCHSDINWYRGHFTVTVQGTNAQEVQEVTLALIEKTKPSDKSPSPWVSGSFYLVVFIVVVVTLSVAGHLLPVYALPTVLISGILALSVIGALQMRQDEKLSEENFLKLMALSFKYLPWLIRRDTQSVKPSREKDQTI